MKETPPIRLHSRLLLATVVTIISLGFLASPWGEAWNRLSYDSLFRMRGPVSAPENIVVVAIDENSFDEINMQWPWPRSMHARLLDSLYAAGARAVVFDLLFAEPSTEEEDRALAEAIDRHQTVAMVNDVSVFEDPNLGYLQEKIVDPVPILAHTKRAPAVGFNNMALDNDGFVRELSLENAGESALALQASKLYSVSNLRISKEATDAPMRINFLGPARTIKTVSYYQALDPKQFLPPDYFQGKLVFVGLATVSEVSAQQAMTDHFPVPFTRWQGGYMAGVEVHAHATSSILSNSFIRLAPRTPALIIGICFGIFAGIVFFRIRPVISLLIFAVLTSVVYGASYQLFAEYFVYVSPVLVLLPLTVCFAFSPFLHYWHARKQRAFIRQAFSTYLSPRLVNRLIEQPDKLKLGGEEIEGTYVFLDIANFTSFSENVPPSELITLLNRNLGALAEVMLRWDGMIDKYIGDSIMAVWGVPILQPDHARSACEAMLEIRKEFERLREVEKDRTGVTLDIRIGVNSGKAVAGNVGGGQQFNYTVLGSEVNLASRLEGVNKLYGTDIIISESTASQIGPEFVLRELDVIRVKGQHTAVSIYDLVGKANEISNEDRQFTECYHYARELYKSRNWSAAAEGFRRALELKPEDRASEEFIVRCEQFGAIPPPESWDGVYEMLAK